MFDQRMQGGNDLVEVTSAGLLTTVQDLGRPGFAHLGVPRSGAADSRSLRLANRLVGNAEDAPALETTLTGPRLRLLGACRIAVTGAAVTVWCTDAGGVRRELPMNTPARLEDGDELTLGPAGEGLRTYLAFGGGLVVERALGSASTDLLTGLGPPALIAGDRLRIGPPGSTEPAGVELIAIAAPDPEPRLRVVLGPRADWFTDAALVRLTSSAFEVTPSSNRIGVRLSGQPLARSREGELPSEGMLPGCIQVPGDGQPIVLGMDHPTTGGYPVIAVVVSDDLPVLGQLRPGQRVRFAAVQSGWRRSLV